MKVYIVKPECDRFYKAEERELIGLFERFVLVLIMRYYLQGLQLLDTRQRWREETSDHMKKDHLKEAPHKKRPLYKKDI